MGQPATPCAAVGREHSQHRFNIVGGDLAAHPVAHVEQERVERVAVPIERHLTDAARRAHFLCSTSEPALRNGADGEA